MMGGTIHIFQKQQFNGAMENWHQIRDTYLKNNLHSLLKETMKQQWPKIRAVLAWDSRGKDLGGQVGDVGWDGVASEELGHLIGERVAVVFKQSVSVASVAPKTKWAFLISST